MAKPSHRFATAATVALLMLAGMAAAQAPPESGNLAGGSSAALQTPQSTSEASPAGGVLVPRAVLAGAAAMMLLALVLVALVWRGSALTRARVAALEAQLQSKAHDAEALAHELQDAESRRARSQVQFDQLCEREARHATAFTEVVPLTAERDALRAAVEEARIEVEALRVRLAEPPVETVAPQPTASPDPLDNRPWLALVEECVELYDELDHHLPRMDPAARETAEHVELRLQEILERCGVAVLDQDETYSRDRHHAEAAGGAAVSGAPIAETLSPGFAIGRRILRKARVRLA